MPPQVEAGSNSLTDGYAGIQPGLKVVCVQGEDRTGTVEAQIAEILRHPMLGLAYCQAERCTSPQSHPASNVYGRAK